VSHFRANGSLDNLHFSDKELSDPSILEDFVVKHTSDVNQIKTT
jgi:hypothetical protein